MDKSAEGEDKRKGGREEVSGKMAPNELPSLVILLFDLR